MMDAGTLLLRYGDVPHWEELRLWERWGEEAQGARYVPPGEPAAKTILCLDGIPGAGKSTTQRWLAPALGARHLSMARFAEARGVSSDERRGCQLERRVPHEADLAFMEELAASRERFILLEKFPRSVTEALLLLERARRHGWRVQVLHLMLPGDQVALSVKRQIERGPRRGRMPELDHAQRRALAHVCRSTSARKVLARHGVPIHAFDMTRPEEENRAAIHRALGLDFESLPWPRGALETLAGVAGRLGVQAFLAGGSLYRAFFNERFGPLQRPTDFDVAVDREQDVAPLLTALERRAPHERWSVLCPATRLWQRHRVQTSDAPSAKSYARFLHRAGVVRLWEGRIDLRLPEGVEAALRNGTVELNPRFWALFSDAQRRAHLQRYEDHLPRVLEDYPGLTLGPTLQAMLQDRLRRPGARVLRGFRALKAEANRSPRPSLRPSWSRRALTPPECAVAEEILRFHRDTEPKAEAPPLPRPAPDSRPPRSLLSHARDDDDATFAAWLLEQLHHHRPEGGADPDVRAVMALDAPLGALHQGWPLGRHLVWSVLQLRTDAVTARVGLPALRPCMRVAMLFHDVGKVVGNKPRRHPEIGAGLFRRMRPAWFPGEWVPFTQWLIRTHDVFGAFARGLTDKVGHAPGAYDVSGTEPSRYHGALDAEAARALLSDVGVPFEHALAIHKALWRADVGAIAALRWLLPVADLVERLLLLKTVSRYVGIERRRLGVRPSASPAPT